MNHAELDALMKLDAERTQGEWRADTNYVVGKVPKGRPSGEVIAEANGPRTTAPQDYANARFIASAPRLAALLRELAAENERLRAAIDCIPILR